MPSLFRLTAEMGLNITPFQAGMRKAEQVANQGADKILHTFKHIAAGYFGFRAVESVIEKTIERASTIGAQAKQYQITTDEVQRLGIAAAEVGLQFEDFGAALSKLGSARQQAVESSAELRMEFERYGISLKELNDPTVRNIDLIKKMSEAMEHAGVMTQKDRQNFRDFFGRSGDRLIEAIRNLKENHEPLISKDDVDAIHEAELAMKALGRHVTTMSSQPLGRLSRIIQNYVGQYRNGLYDPTLANKPEFTPRSTGELYGPFQPGKSPQEMLYQDKIADKEKTSSLQAQLLLEKQISDVIFARLNRSNQLAFLKEKEKALAKDIALQEKQTVDDNYTKAIQEQNIADLQSQQFQVGQQIEAIRMGGFKRNASEIGALRGAAEAIGAGTSNDPSRQLITVNGQQLRTQNDIMNILKQMLNKTERNTITFSP